MSGDHDTKRYIKELTSQIESVTLMYHQSASDASVQRVEIKIMQKKLQTKTKKMEKLEQSMKELMDQNKKLRVIATNLRDAVENDRYVKTGSNSNNLTGIPSKGKVIKKIKAGNKGRQTAVGPL
jgi:septation ring formation regulator EzrA